MKTKIRIDRESGLAYIAKALRAEGFVGEVAALASARTLTLIVPGTRLAHVKRSLETVINELDVRIEYEDEEGPGRKGKPQRKSGKKLLSDKPEAVAENDG